MTMFTRLFVLLGSAPETAPLPKATCIQAKTDWSSIATKPIDYLIGNIYGLATPVAVLLFVFCMVAGLALVRSQKAPGWFKAAGTIVVILMMIPLGAALLYKISNTAPALC